jgi:hypothetical protein
VLELEAFDRLDIDNDKTDDNTKTQTRSKIRKHDQLGTLYIGDSTTKSWKQVPIGTRIGEEDEEVHVQPVREEAPLPFYKYKYWNTIIQETFHDHVLTHFLPAQYPKSVAPGYSKFAALGFCASVAGSTGMVLSTQTLLLAVGIVSVGSNEASVMAGALNWVLKDGVGQLGGVIFASKMGLSRRFDSNPKKWRMVAALALDAANLMEIVSPGQPAAMILPIACLANILKNIGFLTASASRAALHQSLGVAGNLADVTAKAGSQSMAAGLLGTALGVGVSTLLQHNAESFVVAFLFLTAIHQGCNYASLQAVALKHLDRHRLHLLLEQYIYQYQCDVNNNVSIQNMVKVKNHQPIVASPSWVAHREVFVPLFPQDDAHHWLSIGSRLEDLCPGGSDEFTRLLEACSPHHDDDHDDQAHNQAQAHHVINWTPDGRIHLVFLQNASGEDLVKGMLHAYLLRQWRDSTRNASVSVSASVSASVSTLTSTRIHAIAETHRQATEHFPSLLKGLQEEGWTTGTNVTSVEPSNARRLAIDP